MQGFMVRKRKLLLGAVLMLVALGLLTSGQQHSGPLGRSVGVVGAPVQAVVDAVANWIGSVVDNYVLLVDAKEESRRLRAEVDELRRELMKVKEFEYENRRLKALLEFDKSTDLPLLPARVSGRSAAAWYRTLVLDKGTTEGVEVGSPVVTAAGVVGRVYEVGADSCRVLLLTDASSAVDALVQRSRAQLVVEGNMSPNPKLLYLARGVDAADGDKVITSGLDGIYPKGLLLGEISNLKPMPGEIFQSAELSTSVDFARIEEVFVVLRPAGDFAENPVEGSDETGSAYSEEKDK